MDITKEEYEEITNDVKTLKIMVQDLQDIVEDSIGNVNMLSNAIATNNIQDNAITTDKIVANAITTDKLTAEAITASKIAVGTITADQIEDGTIVADKIKSGTITALQISSGTITATQIAASTITANEIFGGTITGDKIAATTIEAGNIVSGTITGTQIHAGTITTDLLEAGAISLSTIGSDFDWATLADKPDNLVQTFYQSAEPNSGMDTGDYWIDSDDNKVYRYNGASWLEVQDDDIAAAISDAADAQSTADGKIVSFWQDDAPTAEGIGDIWFDTNDNNKPYRWSGSAWVEAPQETADWGLIFGTNKPDDNADVTGNNTAHDTSNVNGVPATTVGGWRYGNTTYINGGDIYTNTITANQIAALTITADQMAANSISASKIQSNAITTIKLDAQAVTAAKIETGTITATQIAAGTITADELAANSVTASEINVANLQSVSSTLGTVSAGTISGTRFRVGGGTNEDIYFEDSGIIFRDAGSRTVTITKTSYKGLYIGLQSTYLNLETDGTSLNLGSGGGYFKLFGGSGQLQLPALASDPTTNLANGQIAWVNGTLRIYNSGWSNV